MTKYRIIAALYIGLIVLLLSACKKKEPDPEYKKYMTGVLNQDVPGYLYMNKNYTFTAWGISQPQEGLGYTWIAPGFTPDTCRTQTFACVSPPVTGNYTVTITVSCEEYYDIIATQIVVVIDSLFWNCLSGITEGTDTVTDSRDQQLYHTRTYGPLEWFVQNLNWAGAGYPYAKAEALSTPFGRLYSWNQATGGTAASGLGQGPQGVCPPGWSVPTNEDWASLATVINGGAPLSFFDDWNHIAAPLCAYAKLNDTHIWPYSPRNTKNNQAGWNGLPGGNSTNYGNNYGLYGSYGFWLSSSQSDADNGYYRYIYYDFDRFPYHATHKDAFGASVRCVRLIHDPQ
ncbi:MAG: hypothetical protein FWE30_03725 [Bacteroidales bacterium]|nr:hypothetical protein [Bacteroidales bacterium]